MMATCKNCLHFEVCAHRYEELCKGTTVEDLNHACTKFKDRDLFVELPCKVGDTVYFIKCSTDGNHQIIKGFALKVEYSLCYKPLITIRYNDATLDSTKHYLGLKAFMTRAEAEKALEEMKKK